MSRAEEESSTHERLSRLGAKGDPRVFLTDGFEAHGQGQRRNFRKRSILHELVYMNG